MSARAITCAQADAMRSGLCPLSSLTNYIAGEVLDPTLPPHTATTWGRDDGTAVIRDVLDSSGCRHWRIFEDHR